MYMWSTKWFMDRISIMVIYSAYKLLNSFQIGVALATTAKLRTLLELSPLHSQIWDKILNFFKKNCQLSGVDIVVAIA